MILRYTATGILSLLMLLSLCISVSAGKGEEITSLLNFIEQSKCTFIRNGRQYDSLTSRQHIEKKYNYFNKRITTTEEFIQYSATKSSITGKPYKVICNGVVMDSSDWLRAELDRLRTR
jgi:hypothetical protein